MRYELLKHRQTYKIASERQTIALLSMRIEAHHNMPAMFDDGLNKIPLMARSVEQEMLEWCEKKTVGFVKQNKIDVVVLQNHDRADFYSTVDSEPFCSIVKV